MSRDYEKLRHLLLDAEQGRIQALQEHLLHTQENVPDLVAEDIERGLKQDTPTRLTHALNQATLNGLEEAVQRKPETVIAALFPVIGPAIRRSLQEAMRQLSTDIDRAVNNAFSTRAWKWRLEAWRSGVPYAQVVLRHTIGWRVEHLFLVHPDSGLLYGHLAAPELPELDPDAIAGMFTAIQSFVNDSMQASTQNGDVGIGYATVGDYQLVVSTGPQARLVAFVRGIPGSDFPTRLDEINESLHAQKSSLLAESAGIAGAGLLEPAQLDALNALPQTSTTQTSRATGYILWGLAALTITLLLWWGALQWREHQERQHWDARVQDIRTHLASQPGILITRIDGSEPGTLILEGLRDPLAPDVQAWLSQQHPETTSQWNLRPFISLEPEMIVTRASHALGLSSAHMSGPDTRGTILLEGEVPYAIWIRLTRTHAAEAARLLPGINAIDATDLRYPNQARIEERRETLKNLIVPFTSGNTAPDNDWEATLDQMTATIQELQKLGGQDMGVLIQTAGLTDSTGNAMQNAQLRLQRAYWLAEQLQARVQPPSRVEVNQAVAGHDANPEKRGARAIATLFPVENPTAGDAR